jgi:VanZ family protein
MWPHGWIALAWIALISFGGSRWFGRDGTQRLIDRWRENPRVHAFLNRHHGEIRASFHYIEFGPLSLVVYLIFHLNWGSGLWTWWAALLTILICTLLAYLDEKRQELTPGRQFRTVDFIHSLRALVGMQGIIVLIAAFRLVLG